MTYRGVSRLGIAALSLSLILPAFPIGTLPASAEGLSGLSISVGVDYTTGDYGSTTDTEILSVPVTGKFEVGSWLFAVTVPYIRIDGPGDVVGGGDRVIVTKKGKQRGTTTSTETSGLGDIIAGATYTLLSGPAMPTVDLTGKVKLPTADESKNLGTGEFDYTFLVDAYQKFGSFTPYGSIGYRFVGEPDGVELDNQLLFSVGASVKLDREFTAGLAFDYRTSTSDDVDDPAEISPYFTWRFAPALKAIVYGVVGLSDGGPDYGGGVRLVVAP